MSPAAPPAFPLDGRRIFLSGHRGMVGRALQRRLAGVRCEVLTVEKSEVDQRDQAAVFGWLERARPDIVIIAAARVGGILANSSRPAEFIYDNLAIQGNLIEGSHRVGVQRLLFLGSSCIYPKFAEQPITEDALLTGPLEPTNEWYAIAKIAGIKLCQAYRRQYGRDYISVMPTNLYGPFDNFDLQSSHVLPALMAKTHQAHVTGASELTIWGTGTPRREFMHVDDAADACIFLLEHYSGAEHVNAGTGMDETINEVAAMVARAVGWSGRFVHDLDKPDGTPRKLLDITRLRSLGWSPKIALEDGIRSTYEWYLSAAGKATA